MHFIATKLYWYSAIWWLDMSVHLLGGFWIGLVSIWFFGESLKFQRESKIFSVATFKILLSVFFIGIGWEIFEIFVNDVIAQNAFNYLDTISDVFFDLIGGALAILYFFRRIVLQSKDDP